MPHRHQSPLFRWMLPAAILLAVPVSALPPADLAARLARNDRILVVDVRSAIAYGEGHIPGAINIPLNLLPLKQLPAVPLVVVYGDGLGVVSDEAALKAARAKPGVTAESLEGGYAAWVATTRLSTAVPGVAREKLPGITYQQLLAAGKEDLVLLDLRTGATATPAAAKPIAGRQVAAAPAGDLLEEFAAKLGVPVVRSEASRAAATAATRRAASAASPARAAAPVEGAEPPSALWVLVADNEAEASAAARQLRASGQYRFTLLIGGMESIRHEGRVGSGRMDGAAATKPLQR